jgi:hypothetical protein
VNFAQRVFSVSFLAFLGLETVFTTDVLYPLLSRMSWIFSISLFLLCGIVDNCSTCPSGSELLHIYVQWGGKNPWE